MTVQGHSVLRLHESMHDRTNEDAYRRYSLMAGCDEPVAA
jgi:hypothetical protein